MVGWEAEGERLELLDEFLKWEILLEEPSARSLVGVTTGVPPDSEEEEEVGVVETDVDETLWGEERVPVAFEPAWGWEKIIKMQGMRIDTVQT